MWARTTMSSGEQTGRWVIVIDEGSPAVFWSANRETLDNICRDIRHACPNARVIWDDTGESVKGSALDITAEPLTG